MTISVVIPFYKGNSYLEKLCSTLNQNRKMLYKRCNEDMEVVIVNDSPGISVEIPPGMENVRILENNINSGIQKTRWNGIQASSGRYIMLLDQDDVIEENCIAEQYVAIQDYDYVISNGYTMSKNGNKRLIYENMQQQKILNINYFCRCTNPIISPGQVLLKRDAIPQEWGDVKMEFHGADDLYLWLLLLGDRSLRGTINLRPLYTHVYTGDNTSLDLSLMEKSNLEVLELMKKRISVFNRLCFYRRIKYYSHMRDTLLYKLKYIDVALIRLIYSK